MRYISVCSGIESATVAWHPLGWTAAAFAEIDRFPSQVLKHHYPQVPNHGDFTTIRGDEYGAIDLLVGGTPCQDFSVAGLRAGMDGARGQLTVEFARLAERMRPRWLVWENVPGVLSVDGGRAFGTFLGILGELGYGLAYRVLDAQFFGVPQRRRRVFVVGHLGDWRRAAAVLFERHSLSGHPAPRRKTGQGATYDVAPCIGASGRGFERTGDTRGQNCLIGYGGNNTSGPIDVATAVNACGSASGRMDFESETFVVGTLNANGKAAGSATQQDAETGMLVCAPLTENPYADRASEESLLHVTHSLRADGFDASEDGTGRGTPLVAIAIQERAVSENPDAGPDGAGYRDDGMAYTLEARTVPQAIAFDTTQITSAGNYRNPQPGDSCHPLASGAHPPAIAFDCKASGRNGFGVGEVSPTLRSMGHKDSHTNAGGQVAVMTLAVRGRDGESTLEVREDGLANAVLTPNGGRAGMGVGAVAIGIDSQLNAEEQVVGPLTIDSRSGGGQPARVGIGMAVRRLTPRECSRLQGFPDGYLDISYNGKPAADGPRYKVLGNSMAVPVMRWIGERIQMVDDLI